MLSLVRNFLLAIIMASFAPLPAAAQIFWRAPDFSGVPLTSYETGMGLPLPGATNAEQLAAIAWNMRSGLNVAALQCVNEPTLLTLENYNAILGNHSAELATVFTTLTGYFKRVNKTPRAGQQALDTFGTKTYSGFSSVRALRGFCTAAGNVSRAGLFTPRGGFTDFSKQYLRELRNSLVYVGEQQFRGVSPTLINRVPRLDERCWKKNRYTMSCGLVY